jgi:hypothetical protein
MRKSKACLWHFVNYGNACIPAIDGELKKLLPGLETLKLLCRRWIGHPIDCGSKVQLDELSSGNLGPPKPFNRLNVADPDLHRHTFHNHLKRNHHTKVVFPA